MLRRAAGLLDGRCERVAGGTFHSFANLMLRRYGAALGLASSFTILDRGDSEDVIDLLRARLGLDKKDKRFPRKQVIGELFSMAVNKHRPLDELLGRELRASRSSTPTTCIALQAAYAAYKERAPAARLRRPAGQAARSPRRARRRRASGSRSAIATSWSTSTRTPTRCRRRSSRLLGGHARQRHGRRRRRPEHLLLPRRQLPQHHGLPRPLPGHAGDHARAELPQHAADPRRRQRDHRARPRERYTKNLFTTEPRGQHAAAGRRRERELPVALRLPAHPRAARGGRAAVRDRGALPLELPLLRPRARAVARTTSRSSSAAASSSSRRRTSRTSWPTCG